MATIKQLFEESETGALTWDQFQEAMSKANAKFEDINEGNYFSKRKHEDELNAKLREIEALTGTISSRDTDLAELQKKLEEAGNDAAKLATLNDDFTALQSRYDEDTRNYREMLDKQAYEFAVKEYVNGIKFTSQAAKREFTRSMIEEGLEMEDGEIVGADDFTDSYIEDNEDSFVLEDPGFDDFDDPDPLPQFVAPTSGGSVSSDDNSFADAFHFTGVRPIPSEK